MSVSGEQCLAWLRRLLDFCGDFIPDFFAIEIATLPKFRRALLDPFVGIEAVMSAAKLCVHDNGVAVRNPHGNPLMPYWAQD
jgi:hypothetical protein